MARRSDPPNSRHGRRRSSSSREYQTARGGEEHHQPPNYVLSSVSEYQYAEDRQPRNDGCADMHGYNDAQGQGSSDNHSYYDGMSYDDGQYAYDNDDTMSMIPQNGSSESIHSGFRQTQDPIQQQLAQLADDAADESGGQPARDRAPHPLRKHHEKAAQKVIEEFDDKWEGKSSGSSSSRRKSSGNKGSKKGSSSSGQRR